MIHKTLPLSDLKWWKCKTCPFSVCYRFRWALCSLPFKDVLHRYTRGVRKQWCRYISLFIWLGYNYGRHLRSSRPLRTWYHFSKPKGVNQLWVLKTEAALAPWLHIRLTRKSAGLLFVIIVNLPIHEKWPIGIKRGDYMGYPSWSVYSSTDAPWVWVGSRNLGEVYTSWGVSHIIPPFDTNRPFFMGQQIDYNFGVRIWDRKNLNWCTTFFAVS